MKHILLIGTGGTIASEVTSEGLSPQMDSEQLLRFVPRVRDLCAVDCVQVLNLDSTNMTPADWLVIAQTIRDRYAAYDGFVVSHGTDTLAYTAAALSYLIQRSPKPIVLTGAQKPIHFEVTDSKTNLLDAFTYACSDRACGVTIVFNGSVILGTRAKKVRSKSFSAFSSINYPEIAAIEDGCLLPYIDLGYDGAPLFYNALDTRVGLVKLIPGQPVDVLDFLLARENAVIVESYGVGGVPSAGAQYEASIRRALAAGKTVVVTTQVQNEGSNLKLYSVGHALEDMQVLQAYDMTTEAVVAKLMWILAQTREPARVRALFYTPVQRDLLQSEA